MVHLPDSWLESLPRQLSLCLANVDLEITSFATVKWHRINTIIIPCLHFGTTMHQSYSGNQRSDRSNSSLSHCMRISIRQPLATNTEEESPYSYDGITLLQLADHSLPRLEICETSCFLKHKLHIAMATTSQISVMTNHKAT